MEAKNRFESCIVSGSGQKGEIMKITDFSVRVVELEKGRKEINIAQIKEVMKIINNLLGGELYMAIRKLGKKKEN